MTTFETAHTFTEVKFIVNDSLEFKDQDNRTVDFSKTDTTFTMQNSTKDNSS
jgi:hypothetical protein